MKLALALVIALAACEKTDDLARHQAEVTTIAKYYQEKLDGFQKRMQAILDRTRTLNPTVPGVGDASLKFQQARDALGRLRGLVAQSGKSPIETSAENAAKQGNVDEVIAIADRAHEQLEDGSIEVNADLDAIEGWLARVERQPAPVPPPAGVDPNKPATEAPNKPATEAPDAPSP
jgi:hypothetical protein